MLTHAEPSGAFMLWRAWTFEPGVVIPLALIAATYVRGMQRFPRRSPHRRRRARWRSWAFAAGLTTLVVALVSPLDALADTRFSAHMLQHLLLILVAAPLCVAAAPVPAL